MTLLRTLALLCLIALTPAAKACDDPDLPALAKAVLGDDDEARAQAVKALREAGPAGLAALFKEAGPLIDKGPSEVPHTQWEHLTLSMDEVAMAHDAYSSGLYWYTDLEKAEHAAKVSNKPILSLRLLGNLDEDFSCANSRYFRTVLYANKEVSTYLRENYILHWQSIRRVPRVTIDLGDGRKIERTITGNSVHYILDKKGNVVDALPGLYSPAPFLRALDAAAHVEHTPAARRDFARTESAAIGTRWLADLSSLNIEVKIPPTTDKDDNAAGFDLQTVTKSMGERRVLREIFPAAAMQQATDTAGWTRVANLHRPDATLDAGSLRLMRDKSPLMRAQSSVAGFNQMIAAFEQSIALDTVRNDYLYRRTILDWLATTSYDVQTLNKRVYSEIFQNPDRDPWLGLLPADVYIGLDNDGAVDEPPMRQRK